MSSTSSSSTTESSSTISTTSAPTSLPHIQHLITIKLNRDNFLLWKAQIVPYLQGQHLYGFIDGTKPAPPPSLAIPASGTTTVLPNPEFYTWHMTQDQMILSVLISSLLKIVLAHDVKCTTSRDVWLCLERMFTSQSRARSMQLHYQISTLKKGDSFMDFDLVSFFLARLGSDYDALVTAIQQRRGDVTLDELYGDFFSHEWRLAQHQPSVDLSLASANFANRSFSNHGDRGGKSSTPPASSNSVCTKPGHTTLTCYHRFDNSYTVVATPNMQALLATPNHAPDPNWYSDSGATHHLTYDLANLNVCANEYHGPDQIRVGFGFGENTVMRAE
uniref:Retrotransposon Copia-like N-terminal domain-containing protein n=1 Tax=Fagus sylvatica TaxID=28930 RepID=A0A2N9HT68_FAGSY